jgi:hypothetical protein
MPVGLGSSWCCCCCHVLNSAIIISPPFSSASNRKSITTSSGAYLILRLHHFITPNNKLQQPSGSTKMPWRFSLQYLLQLINELFVREITQDTIFSGLLWLLVSSILVSVTACHLPLLSFSFSPSPCSPRLLSLVDYHHLGS